jgi:hypothetical protein
VGHHALGRGAGGSDNTQGAESEQDNQKTGGFHTVTSVSPAADFVKATKNAANTSNNDKKNAKTP